VVAVATLCCRCVSAHSVPGGPRDIAVTFVFGSARISRSLQCMLCEYCSEGRHRRCCRTVRVASVLRGPGGIGGMVVERVFLAREWLMTPGDLSNARVVVIGPFSLNWSPRNFQECVDDNCGPLVYLFLWIALAHSHELSLVSLVSSG
jgi:hypothetical protein